MSIRVFREFLTTRADGTVDASRITSKECYEAFLAAKKAEHSEAESKKYRRVLTTHLTGVDGRRPFEKHEEEAILQLLRQNKPWPCFPLDMQVGSMFRGKGFHEKQAILGQAAAGSPPPRARSAADSTGSNKRTKVTQLPPPLVKEEEAAFPAAVLPAQPILPPVGPIATSSVSEAFSADQVARNVLSQSDSTFVFTLASEVVKFSSSFAVFGMDVWRSIFGIFRFVILARTAAVYQEVSDEYAQQLCERVSQEDGHLLSVTVMDVLGKDFDKRIRAQNAASMRLFGDIPRAQNTEMRMQSHDLFDIAMAIGSSYALPGHTYFILNQCFVIGGETKYVKIAYRVDPASFLLTCKAIPVDKPAMMQLHSQLQ